MSDTTSKQSESASASMEAKASEKESILDKVRKNVEKLKEAKKNAGGTFLKIQPGEVKVLQFTGDMEPVAANLQKKEREKRGRNKYQNNVCIQSIGYGTPRRRYQSMGLVKVME